MAASSPNWTRITGVNGNIVFGKEITLPACGKSVQPVLETRPFPGQYAKTQRVVWFNEQTARLERAWTRQKLAINWRFLPLPICYSECLKFPLPNLHSQSGPRSDDRRRYKPGRSTYDGNKFADTQQLQILRNTGRLEVKQSAAKRRPSRFFVFGSVFSVLVIILALFAWWLFAPQKQTITFSSGSPHGMYHEIALAIEEVIENVHPGIDIVVKTSGGSSVNLERIDQLECDLALVQNDALGGQHARSIAAIYPEVLHLVCRRDAEIHSMDGLNGKTVNIGPDGSGTQQVVQALFEFISASPKKEFKFPVDEAVAALNEGKLDAAFFLTGLPGQLMDDLLRNDDLVLVPIVGKTSDPDDVALASERFVRGFQTKYPFVSPQTIPMMTYHGLPTEPVPTLGVSAVLVGRQDIPDGVIQEFTRTLFDHRVDLANRVSVFSGLDEEDSTSNLRFPVHEGAEAYYRRREPNFLTKHAEAMGFILTIVVLVWSGLATSNRIMTKERKNYIDIFYAEIDGIMEKLKTIESQPELTALEDELFLIDERIRKDLIAEQLEPDQSFLIFQNMYQHCAAAIVEKRSHL